MGQDCDLDHNRRNDIDPVMILLEVVPVPYSYLGEDSIWTVELDVDLGRRGVCDLEWPGDLMTDVSNNWMSSVDFSKLDQNLSQTGVNIDEEDLVLRLISSKVLVSYEDLSKCSSLPNSESIS
ncbi:hypothetical protein WICPIJ_008843 [Wickerhamomyces pijperi]|uniref:Uncharacterized protein n=1 Tax=Wickerhamomyces pijperi TaxID=599730 RepID=A0A9P8PU17_WICPI|nr:hypothetical protein WICPIJ_008843 [Wickerhamomyces pijperi]